MDPTEVGLALTYRNHAAQQSLALRLIAALLEIWRLLRFDRLDESTPLFVQAAMPVLREFHIASQVMALDYLSDLRMAEAAGWAPTAEVFASGPLPRALLEVTGPDGVIDGGLVRDGDQAGAGEGAEELVRFATEEEDEEPPSPEPEREGEAGGDGELASRLLIDEIVPLNEDAAAVSLAVTGPARVKALMPAPEQEAMDSAFASMALAATRIVLDGGRAQELKEARRAVGYARILNDKACAFCAMLASRGPVFDEDSFDDADARFTGGGEAKVHDGCACSFKPVYDDDQGWLEESRRIADLWEASTRGLSGSAARNAFRRAWEDRTLPGDPIDPRDADEDTREQLAPAQRGAVLRRDLAQQRNAYAARPPEELARALLPGFEENLQRLLADGMSEDAPPVRYHRQEIARHRRALGLPDDVPLENASGTDDGPPPQPPDGGGMAAGDDEFDEDAFRRIPLASETEVESTPVTDLSDRERDAIRYYATDGYEEINQALNGTGPMTAVLQEDITAIREALHRHPLPRTVRVTREVEARQHHL